ncbi:MAG: hypothetical protein KBD90_02780, partial [Alphaproteobacteria bacterium]|nr:hypothetical protein [Alphaproteobacteria bacterium]
NASHVQSVHQHAKDTGFDKTRAEKIFFNPKESENSQQQESPVKQVAQQSIDHSINGGSTPLVQDNVQTQPQQATDNASIQSQTPSPVQSAQPEERDAGLGEGNSDKFHSGNTPLHRAHSDQAPLHSKQIENSPQENVVKQTAPQFSGQSIHGENTPPVQDNIQTQPQQSTDNASIQSQTPSRVQSAQPEERDAGLGEGNSDKFHSENTPLHQIHSDQASLHSKQAANSSQESSVKQAASQSVDHSINGGSTLPVQGNIQTQPQQNTDNTSIQAQTRTHAQSVQTEGRVAGLDKENSNKFHSSNTPLHQIHSDQAPLHSKQIENLPQENDAKQAVLYSTGQSIHGAAIPSSINTASETQAQPQLNNAGVQAQDIYNIQRGQQQAKDTGFDKKHLEQRFFNSKGPENSQQQENSIKQAAPQFSGQSIHGGETLSSGSTLNEIQTQSQPQPNNAGHQVQTPSNAQMMQQYLKEEVSDKPKTANPQQESIKDFFERKLEETDEKIAAGQKSITDQEKPLRDKYKAAQDKTLLGTAVKNLATSTGKGLLSVGKDINEAVKKLPPEPPIIFP